MIEPLKINNTQTIVYKVKKYFNVGSLKLRTLLKDVFEKSETNVKKQGNYMNAKSEKNIRYPNSFSAPDEVFSTGGGSEISFYPEDLKKMEKMNIDEVLEYKEKLINEKKYKMKSRELPNSVGGLEDDFSGNQGYKVKFYQEDIEKMKDMSLSEKQSYIAELIKNGKFIDEQN